MKQPYHIVLLFLVAILFSCKKDSDEAGLTKETISAKWVVTGSTNGYESFEFNKSGNYIIVVNTTNKSTASQSVLFGTYTITDNNIIELSNFGKITISSIENDQINFYIQLQDDPQNGMTIHAVRATEYGDTNRTELLCKTWKVVSINGESVAGTEDEVTILFSLAGTYLVVRSDGESGMAQWKWKDSNESIMCYSWEGEPTCNGEEEVQILELTANSAKVLEVIGGETYIYLLVPASDTKSATLQSISSEDKQLSPRRFFRK